MKLVKTLGALSLLCVAAAASAKLHWNHAYVGGEFGIADLGTGVSDLYSTDGIVSQPELAPFDQSADATDAAWGVRAGVRPLKKGNFDFDGAGLSEFWYSRV